MKAPGFPISTNLDSDKPLTLYDYVYALWTAYLLASGSFACMCEHTEASSTGNLNLRANLRQRSIASAYFGRA